MPYTVKDWRDDPSTPLFASDLDDLEARIVAYARSLNASYTAPYTPKNWDNDPASGVTPEGTDTPLSAAALIDLETRLAAWMRTLDPLFVDPGFTPKAWQDAPPGWQPGDPIPAGATPIDSVALEDLETRLTGYMDALVASSPGVEIAPPANTDPPTIDGIAVVGQTLTGSDGTWTGDALSFAYQWDHVDDGPIAGATSPTYVLAAGDEAHAIQFRVIVTNDGGTTVATSAATDPVEPAPTPGQFERQSFIAADGTLVQTLANMVKHPAATNDAAVKANRVYPTGSSGGAQALYYDTATPPIADYEVTATLALITDNNSSIAGPMARLDPATFSGYQARYNTALDRVELYRFDNGSQHFLASAAMAIPTNLTVRCIGSQISALADGVTVAGPITDATYTAPGTVGFRFAGSGGATTGIHIDTLVADTVQLIDQTFTAADGTLVQTLPNMVKHVVATNDAAVKSNAAYATGSSSGAQAFYYDSTALPTADYQVTAALVMLSDNNSSTAGPVARIDTTVFSGYLARYNTSTNAVELYRLNSNGGQSLLGSAAVPMPAELTVQCVGNQISAVADGVVVVGPVTDATWAGPGQAGFRLSGSVAATTGLHIDELTATLGGGAAAPPPPPPPAGNAKATFTATPDLNVWMTLDATGSVGDGYSWTIDGQPLSDVSALVSVPKSLGDHTVTLTVTDSATGTTDTVTQTVTWTCKLFPYGAQYDTTFNQITPFVAPVINVKGPWSSIAAMNHDDVFTQTPDGARYALYNGDKPTTSQTTSGGRVICSLHPSWAGYEFDWNAAGVPTPIDLVGNNDGAIRFMRWEFMLPGPQNPPVEPMPMSNMNTMWEIRSEAGVGIASLIPAGTVYRLYLGSTMVAQWPIVLDQWENFVFEWRFSTGATAPDGGYFRVFKDGVNVLLGVTGADAEGRFFFQTLKVDASGNPLLNTVAAKFYGTPAVGSPYYIVMRNTVISKGTNTVASAAYPRDFNDGILGPPTNWPGAQFGASNTDAGVPAVSLIDPTDTTLGMPANPPAYAKKVLQLIAGPDPLRAGGSARAEVAQNMSSQSGGVPPFVDANGFEWYTPEWQSDRTKGDPSRFFMDGVMNKDGSPMERWSYWAMALPADPTLRPGTGYLLMDHHAKLGVNFIIRIHSSNPDALEVVIRGGRFEALTSNATPAWAQPGSPDYTGYFGLYAVAAYDGAYDSTRRAGEWPNQEWDFVNHQPIPSAGTPKNGVPLQAYGQQYQRFLTVLNPIPWGTWMTFEHRKVWSNDTRGGHQLWINGTLVLDVMGVPTLYKWSDELKKGDVKVGYDTKTDPDQQNRAADYFAAYEQLQNYSGGQPGRTPASRAWFAPFGVMPSKLATPPW